MAGDGGLVEFHHGDNYCKPIETTVIKLSMVGRRLYKSQIWLFWLSLLDLRLMTSHPLYAIPLVASPTRSLSRYGKVTRSLRTLTFQEKGVGSGSC